jgi:selenocysteine-specific elongation factor
MLRLEAGDRPGLSDDDLVINRGLWGQLSERAIEEVARYHHTYPLRPGMPREELKGRLKNLIQGSTKLFNAGLRALVAQGALKEDGPLVMLPEYRIRFTNDQQNKIEGLMARFAASPFSPPTLKECQAEVGEGVTNALIDLGQLVQVGPEVAFRREDYDRIVVQVHQTLKEQGTLTVAEARDQFNTSRRYVLALLEHLDAIGITVREGDARRLKSA